MTALARGVVAKLLHEPIVRLKETPGSRDAGRLRSSARRAVRARAPHRVKLRIGTRGSRLALAQAREVADALDRRGRRDRARHDHDRRRSRCRPRDRPRRGQGPVRDRDRPRAPGRGDRPGRPLGEGSPGGRRRGRRDRGGPRTLLGARRPRDARRRPADRGARRDLEHPSSGAGVPVATRRAGEGPPGQRRHAAAQARGGGGRRPDHRGGGPAAARRRPRARGADVAGRDGARTRAGMPRGPGARVRRRDDPRPSPPSTTRRAGSRSRPSAG